MSTGPARSRNWQSAQAGYRRPANRLRLGESLHASLVQLHKLPGLEMQDLERAEADLLVWRRSLAMGLVPEQKLRFPAEPLMAAWRKVLLDLDLPHFTRRHPVLLDMCLQHMLDLVAAFEREKAELEPEMEMEPSEFESQEHQDKKEQLLVQNRQNRYNNHLIHLKVHE